MLNTSSCSLRWIPVFRLRFLRVSSVFARTQQFIKQGYCDLTNHWGPRNGWKRSRGLQREYYVIFLIRRVRFSWYPLS
jgi:hypothetical protein